MTLTCLPCIIGYGFVGASLYTSLSKHAKVEGLTPEQELIKNKIVDNRKRIYFTSLMVGVILALAYLQGLAAPPTNKDLCVALLILTSFTHMCYMLWPKGDLMVEHLRQDQVGQWADSYKAMSRKYHLGFVMGALGFVLISKGAMCD